MARLVGTSQSSWPMFLASDGAVSSDQLGLEADGDRRRRLAAPGRLQRRLGVRREQRGQAMRQPADLRAKAQRRVPLETQRQRRWCGYLDHGRGKGHRQQHQSDQCKENPPPRPAPPLSRWIKKNRFAQMSYQSDRCCRACRSARWSRAAAHSTAPAGVKAKPMRRQSSKGKTWGQRPHTPVMSASGIFSPLPDISAPQALWPLRGRARHGDGTQPEVGGCGAKSPTSSTSLGFVSSPSMRGFVRRRMPFSAARCPLAYCLSSGTSMSRASPGRVMTATSKPQPAGLGLVRRKAAGAVGEDETAGTGQRQGDRIGAGAVAIGGRWRWCPAPRRPAPRHRPG